MENSLTFRTDVHPDDRAAVRSIVASSGFFSAEETVVAVELIDARLRDGDASGYFFLLAEREGRVEGYTCFGPVPCTQSSYDLYWIAVHERARDGGLGRELMRRTEEIIAARGGQRVYAETSSRPQYEPTRRFYERCGFVQAACLEDFYAKGDGKIIFARRLPDGPG